MKIDCFRYTSEIGGEYREDLSSLFTEEEKIKEALLPENSVFCYMNGLIIETVTGEAAKAYEKYKEEDRVKPGDGLFICSGDMWKYLCAQEVWIDFLKSDNAREWGELLLLRVIDKIQNQKEVLSLVAIVVR